MNKSISKNNVSQYVKGRYGITMHELFEVKKDHPDFFQGIMEDVFEEFTNSIPARKPKFLETFNPYTQKMETFQYTRGRLISSEEELVQNLIEVNEERIHYLNRSFYKELGIQKLTEQQVRSKQIEDLSKSQQEKEDLEL